MLDLAQMANGLRASTAAALENAAAAQADAAAQARLTAAMEAATVAAGAQASAVGASEVALSAASKGGILQALASFGSLRGALNGIGTAITGLVGGPIVALVASIGFVAVEAVKLVSNLKDWHDITEKLAAQQKELAAAQDVLVEKAKQVAAQTKASADVQIASAQQLSAMSKRQSEDYVEQLQNAVRYYTAMRVQAQASGDSAGVQMATAHLRDLVVALGDAKESSEKATESLGKISDRAAAVADRFDALRTKGESAATSVAGAFSNIEIATPKGLQDVLDIVAQVSIRSADAKTAVQTELAGALQKLNEQDLADFQRNINDRLKEAKGNAQDLSTALSASLEASLLKLGISAQQAGIQISEADQKIVTSFKSIAENAKATGEQVQLAFANALSKLETTGAVDALKRSLQEAFDSGRISAAQFESGMDAAGRKLADVQVAAAQASSNLDGMGVAGQTAAQRISSSLQDTRDRLVVQASQIVAAIAAGLQHGDDVAALRAQYRALDAQIQALNDDINKLPAGFDAAG
ncbi:MAG: hypothetical protein JSS28_09715, partial [Proteobacteria bacterium]|nr:hypothetical protein [Pseudomonadota bacterium]